MDYGELDLAKNSALLAAWVCLLSLPVGSLLGFLLVRTDLPGRGIYRAILGVWLFVPLYLYAAGWQAAFGVQGWYTLIWSGSQQPQAAWLQGWRGAVWVHAMAAIPWTALIVGGGLRFVEPELEEEALLNARSGKVFWRVTLRRALAAVGVAALWILISTSGEMTVTDFFQVRTYAEVIYLNLNLGAEPEATTLSMLPGVLFTAGLAVAAIAVCAALTPAMRQAVTRPPWCFSLGRWKPVASLAVAIVLLIVVGVPVFNLLFKAGELTVKTGAGIARGWSLAKCGWFIVESPVRHYRELGASLLISFCAATTALILAIPWAWWARQTTGRANLALLATAIGLALPGPVIGVLIIWLMNRPELPWLTALYDRSIAAPWLALTLRALPLTILIVWYALRTVPGETIEAASSEGAGALRRLVSIVLPQRKAALAAAWLVAFIVAMGDVAASILVLPPGVTTLSYRVFQELHSGQEDYVAGICLFLMLGVVACANAIGALLKAPDQVTG